MLSNTLKVLRAHAGITQSEMANRIGLSLRQYQEIEGAAAPVREIHRLAVDLASLELAIERRNPALATEPMRERIMAYTHIADPLTIASEGADVERARLKQYLDEVRSRIDIPGVKIDGRVHDYGFRWELALLHSYGVTIVGDWPKGQRPQPDQAAEQVRWALTHEHKARQIHREDKPVGVLHPPRWEDLSDEDRRPYRDRAWTI